MLLETALLPTPVYVAQPDKITSYSKQEYQIHIYDQHTMKVQGVGPRGKDLLDSYFYRPQ